MEAIARGDRGAFSQFYDRYSPPVFAYCLRALQDRPEAEDLLVDVFAEIWARADRYDRSRSKPYTYLMNVTRARLIDRLRSLRAKRSPGGFGTGDRSAVDDIRERAAPGNSPPLEAALAEDRLRVLRAMDGLTAEQRSLVELAFFDCYSHSEIAEKLQSPLGTVKSRIRQALSKLRDSLGGT